MPFAPHLRVTALGTIGGTPGTERFSYGLSMEAEVPGQSQMVSDSEATDIAADLRAFHVNVNTGINDSAILREVKFASIGADGKYTQDPIVKTVLAAPGGRAADVKILPQSALALSLGTDRRGPTGKGRFFVPMPTFQLLANTFLIGTAEADLIRTQLQTLINAVNNEPGLDGFERRVVVASTKGYNSRVTSVRVGRLIDTMRSRRTSLGESYTASVPIAA
jgi:hypothetical protein